MNIEVLTWSEYQSAEHFDYLITDTLPGGRVKAEWDTLNDAYNGGIPNVVRGAGTHAYRVSYPLCNEAVLPAQLDACKGKRVAIRVSGDRASDIIELLNSRKTAYLSSLVGSDVYFAIVCDDSHIKKVVREKQLWRKQWTMYLYIEPGVSGSFMMQCQSVDGMPVYSKAANKLFSVCVESQEGSKYIDLVTVVRHSNGGFVCDLNVTIVRALCGHILRRPTLQSHSDYALTQVLPVQSIRRFGRWIEFTQKGKEWKEFVTAFGKDNLLYRHVYEMLIGIIGDDIPRAYDHVLCYPIFYKVLCGHIEKIDPGAWKYCKFIKHRS